MALCHDLECTRRISAGLPAQPVAAGSRRSSLVLPGPGRLDADRRAGVGRYPLPLPGPGPSGQLFPGHCADRPVRQWLLFLPRQWPPHLRLPDGNPVGSGDGAWIRGQQRSAHRHECSHPGAGKPGTFDNDNPRTETSHTIETGRTGAADHYNADAGENRAPGFRKAPA